jgi:NADP-dependent 3-hydroxy acid dehydrogenase YdfG
MLSAVITGTSTGIGLETALLFARRGYRVYAGARNPAASEGLQRAVGEGLPLTPIALDVDRDESVRQAVAKVGPVDVLVNNAGIAASAPVELMPMEETRALFQTNVFGAVRMMQAVLPSLRERRAGAIVNVTSIMGRITLPCNGYYSATKFAVAALTETLANGSEAIRQPCHEHRTRRDPHSDVGQAAGRARDVRLRPGTGTDVAFVRGADGRRDVARRGRSDLPGGHRGRASPRAAGKRCGCGGNGAVARNAR